MPPSNQPPQTKPLKLLYQIPLFIFFFVLFFHTSISPNNLFTRTVGLTTNFLDKQMEKILTNRNFLSNPSFEKTPSFPSQIPGWIHSGWQLNQNRSASGKQSVSSLDLVVNPLHEIKQTVYFFFPGQSRLQLTFNSFSEAQGAKINIGLTASHLNFLTTRQNREDDLPISADWEPKKHLFILDKDAYRLDLTITVNNLNPQPVYLDDFSLVVLTTEQLNLL